MSSIEALSSGVLHQLSVVIVIQLPIIFRRVFFMSPAKKYLARTRSICNYFCNQYTLSTCHVRGASRTSSFTKTKNFRAIECNQ